MKSWRSSSFGLDNLLCLPPLHQSSWPHTWSQLASPFDGTVVKVRRVRGTAQVAENVSLVAAFQLGPGCQFPCQRILCEQE